MMTSPSGGVTFVNADIGTGDASSLRIAGSRIVAVGSGACPGDCVVDLRGDRLLPGLINAHDHLHLNTVSPLDTTERWLHVREWIAHVNLRRRTDSAFESQLAVSRDERLLIGGVKNVLSGVTTVAHHDVLYPFLMDEESAGEFDRLDALGCLRANTLIVHGIALDRTRRVRLEQTGAGLIWCPSSNLRLFGSTAEVSELARGGRVALGTDSRLTGSRDLLCELEVARESSGLAAATLESLVTRDAATLLRLNDRGVLRVGARADLLVLPGGMTLPGATRSDVRLVMLGGLALYADADYARIVAPTNHWTPVRVDCKPKMLESGLATALRALSVVEPGLEISDLAWRAA
jgi:cytosine/adenosine deaminase-related metal-dependent hydrolase